MCVYVCMLCGHSIFFFLAPTCIYITTACSRVVVVDEDEEEEENGGGGDGRGDDTLTRVSVCREGFIFILTRSEKNIYTKL